MANSASSSSNSFSTIAVAAVAVAAHAIALSVLLKHKNDEKDDDSPTGRRSTAQKTAPLCNHHNHQGSCNHDNNDDDAVIITLPGWSKAFMQARKDKVYKSDDGMMQVAMDLANINITKGTGGPFGTAIFEHDVLTGESKLFSVGMNQVVSLGNSTLHGEMTAIQFGEKKLGSFTFPRTTQKTKDLIGSTKEYHLYTSCDPCCQCLGGTLWSGVSKLVCGADKADAEAIGFDEGPVFASSYDALEAAGITVKRGVLREQGAEILRRYAATGVIYNADSA